MSSNPKFQDREIAGVRIFITNSHTYRPVITGIHLLCTLYDMLSKEERGAFFRQIGFDELAGTKSLRQAIEEGATPEKIVADWALGVERFVEKRRKYLLY